MRRETRKRIERLEASVRSLKIEDAKRRHLESLSKMSDEEVVSAYFAFKQLHEVAEKGDPWKANELFGSGLAATEHLEERARLGWQSYCDTGARAAAADFYEANGDEMYPTRTPGVTGDVKGLFEGPKPSSSRLAGIRFHLDRLATEQEKKALSKLKRR